MKSNSDNSLAFYYYLDSVFFTNTLYEKDNL